MEVLSKIEAFFDIFDSGPERLDQIQFPVEILYLWALSSPLREKITKLSEPLCFLIKSLV